MFFCLAKQADLRFPNHTSLGSWILSHDNGWIQDQLSITKCLGNVSDDIAPWTRFEIKDSLLSLKHSVGRGYPLYWNHERQILSNLLVADRQIWCDDVVCLDNNGILIDKKDIIGKICTETLDTDSVIQTLIQKFHHQIRKLFVVTSMIEKKHFVTGGIDSALIRALLISNQLDYEDIDHEHFDYDYFTNEFITEIKKNNWAYNQIHHWKHTSILLSGSCGDEFMMRGPNTIALWCAWHDIDFSKILQQNQGYHVSYFSKPKNQKIWRENYNNRDMIRNIYPTKESLYRQICDMNMNDHQHWHLGHTFTWSPFCDIEITKLMLRLPFDDLIEHFIDATISKKIIHLLDAGSLLFLSPEKNQSSRKVCNNGIQNW